jgi:hypothetical protein
MEAEKEKNSGNGHTVSQYQPSATNSQNSKKSTDLTVTGGTNKAEEPADTFVEQSKLKVCFVLSAVLISMFLVALDRTIITTVCTRLNV